MHKNGFGPPTEVRSTEEGGAIYLTFAKCMCKTANSITSMFINLLLAAYTLAIASFIALCIYPPALAWAVNLVFYLLLKYNQKLGVKKVTVKSIDVWKSFCLADAKYFL